MKILLTGARGMVGRNFSDYVHESRSSITLLEPARSELDLSDASSVDNYIQAHRPDIVIHAAGRVGGIQANIRNPVEFLTENLEIGTNVLLASKRNGVKRLLNLGSSCMYPRNAANPLREEDILQGELEPTNEGYALAKIVVARLGEYISRADDYNYKTIIPCNIYGPYDKFDPGHSHMVPAIIHKIHVAKLNGDQSVEIWGDGSARREFMHARDLASCMLRCVSDFETLPALMNVGTGKDYSVLEYYQAASEVIGFDGGFHHDLSKPTGMNQKLVSCQLAENWGWKSEIDLSQGINSTYNFYLKNAA